MFLLKPYICWWLVRKDLNQHINLDLLTVFHSEPNWLSDIFRYSRTHTASSVLINYNVIKGNISHPEYGFPFPSMICNCIKATFKWSPTLSILNCWTTLLRPNKKTLLTQLDVEPELFCRNEKPLLCC